MISDIAGHLDQQLMFGNRTGQMLLELAGIKNEEGGDAQNVELGSQFRVFFSIELSDPDFALGFDGQSVHHGTRAAAHTAPWRPAIEQYRQWGLEHGLGKVRVGHHDWLTIEDILVWQRISAAPALGPGMQF